MGRVPKIEKPNVTADGGILSVLLVALLLLVSCDPSGSSQPAANWQTPVSDQLVSSAGSSNTVAAISSGLNPDRTLINDEFGCFEEGQIDIRQPTSFIQVDGPMCSIQQVGANNAQSGTINQLDAQLSTNPDVVFTSGPPDGQDAAIRFNS